MWVEGARQVAHPSLLCYHTLCSMFGAVERDFVTSVDVHPERRVTSDHEHPLDFGCSILDPHHLFPSFDSYCAVYALARDHMETRVLFLSVYLAYKEDSSEKKSKTTKRSKIKKISTKL